MMIIGLVIFTENKEDILRKALNHKFVKVAVQVDCYELSRGTLFDAFLILDVSGHEAFNLYKEWFYQQVSPDYAEIKECYPVMKELNKSS